MYSLSVSFNTALQPSASSEKLPDMSILSPFRLLAQLPLLAPKALRLWKRAGLAGIRWRLRLFWHQTHGYDLWLLSHDRLDDASRRTVLANIDGMANRPLISILMPTHNTPELWLRRAIDSVRGQLYPHWQLCIADDASTAPHVRPLLESFAASDERIRLRFRASPGHISLASATALELAEGEFIALLDHDDELHPLALYRVAAEINLHPDVELIYSDEDKIGTDGRRYDPHFKPDWNPELLRTQNYICHLAVYRAQTLQAVGGFRLGLEGAQDWDIALRVSENANCIRHLPYILYHWRTVPGSTARSDSAKDYALGAGCRAVQDHLERRGEKAVAELLDFGHLRIRRVLPDPPPRVSIILNPTKQGATTLRCLESLEHLTHYPDYEVLVAGGLAPGVSVDQRGLAESAPHFGPELPLRDLNQAASRANGMFLCFVNGACEIPNSEWLTELIAQSLQPEVGAVGARLLRPDGRVWHAGYWLDSERVVVAPYCGAPATFPGLMNRALLQQNISAVSAACMVVSKSYFEQIGGFDEAAGCYADIDLCLKLHEIGLRNVWTPHVTLRLKELPSMIASGADDATGHMLRRWPAQLARDPVGNPNLALDHGLPVPVRT